MIVALSRSSGCGNSYGVSLPLFDASTASYSSRLTNKWAALQEGILYKYLDNLYIVRDVVENPLSSTAVRQAVQQVRLLTLH